jgi:hypothetical protein
MILEHSLLLLKSLEIEFEIEQKSKFLAGVYPLDTQSEEKLCCSDVEQRQSLQYMITCFFYKIYKILLENLSAKAIQNLVVTSVTSGING